MDRLSRLRCNIGRRAYLRSRKPVVGHGADGVAKRPRHFNITKSLLRKAIEGSRGVRSYIAERLGCALVTLNILLNKEGWEDVREVYDAEIEKLGDAAEVAIKEAVEQRVDIATASRTAQWILSRKRFRDRGMGDESKLIVEGGDRPITTINHTLVDIEGLNLPVEVMRALLEAIERKAVEKALPDALPIITVPATVPALPAPITPIVSAPEPVSSAASSRRRYACKKGKQ